MPTNLIKSSNGASGSVRRNLLKNSVFEATAEAAEIIREARESAAEIIVRAEQEAENMRQSAYQAGREEAAEEFGEVITAAFEKRETALLEVETDVLKLSIKLAEKIIGREIQTDRTAIIDIVSTALRHVRQQERLIVHVNAADLLHVEAQKVKFSHAGRAEFLDFEADPKVTAAGCIIESEVGTVDARLETQLKILERALLKQNENNV